MVVKTRQQSQIERKKFMAKRCLNFQMRKFNVLKYQSVQSYFQAKQEMLRLQYQKDQSAQMYFDCKRTLMKLKRQKALLKTQI